MNDLLEELKSAYQKAHIPDNAITASQLAEELECSIRAARDILYNKFLLGELARDRKSEGMARVFYYWKPDEQSDGNNRGSI